MSDDKVLAIDTSALNRGLRELERRVGANADKALGKVALHVEARARALAPIETGALRAAMGSAWPDGENAPPAEHDGEEIPRFPLEPQSGEAYVYNTMRYAAAQHEGLEFEHPKGGQAKFIEQPLVEDAPLLVRTLAETMLQ